LEKSLKVNNSIIRTPNTLNIKLHYFFYSIFIFFIPFQKVLVKYFGAPKYLLYVDEILSLILFFSFLIIVLNKRKIKSTIFPFLFIFLLFFIFGIISGLFNRNKVIITFLGIFDYLKNFIFVIGCYYFFRNYRFLKFIYNMLLKFVFIYVIISIIQEIIFFIGGNVNKFFVPFVITRFGILRTPSLLGHPNIFGLYILLFFTLNLFIKKRFNFMNIIILIGIFLSLSRFIWVSAIMIILLFSFEKRKITYKFLIFILLGIFLLFAAPYFITHTNRELLTENYFRGYSLFKSIEIWKDNKIFGVGPGMYGGVISIMFNSPIYNKYSFSYHWYEFMKGFNSIDQFYPQLLAETGIFGFLCFIGLMISLLRIPKKASKKILDPFLKGLLNGLSKIPIILLFYLIGSGLNMTAFLVTYTSILGMALGVMKYENSTRK